MPELSRNVNEWYTSNLLQVYHFQLKPGKEVVFRKFMENFNSRLNKKTKNLPIVWMKTVSGGNNAYVLFVGFDQMAAFEMLESLFLFSNSQTKTSNLLSQSVAEIKTELWRHNENLTYIPEESNSKN